MVEGEKDVEALEATGVTATCNPMGAGAWKPHYTPLLAGADVVIVADNDDAGRAHARQVAAALAGVAASVRLVRAKEGKDAADHLAAGHGVADFLLLGEQGASQPRGEGEEEVAEPPPPLPTYPVDALPGPLRDLVFAGTAAGLPAELVAGAGLGVASIVTMPAEIVPDRDRPTWRESSALWIALLASTGGGKTPALNLAGRALRELEAATDAAHAVAYAAWKERQEEAKRDKRAFTEAAPGLRLLTADDITIEAFLADLAANNGQLAVDVDELRTHLRAMGRYRQRGDGGEHARWLNLWAGTVVQYRRRSMDARLRVDRPVVPVLGGLQPHLLHELGDDEDGSRARWLPHYSDRPVLHTRAAEEPARWRRFVEQAYSATASRQWHLDDATRRVWDDARHRWKSLDGGPSVVGAAAKAASQSLRLTEVCAEILDPGRGGRVPPEALSAGIAVVDYALGVWRALGGSSTTLYTSRREEVYGTAAHRLAAWVGTRGGRATRRDILRAQPCGIEKAAQLDAVLAEYRQLWLGTVRDEETPGGGPRAQVIYAPRDPRPYAPYTYTEDSSSRVVGSPDNTGEGAEKQEDHEESSQVSEPPGGTNEDHNVVGDAEPDNEPDNVDPTTSRSSESADTLYVSDEPSDTRYVSDSDPVDHNEPDTTEGDEHRGEGDAPLAVPELIDSVAGWDAVLPEVLAAKTVGLDLETIGLDPHTARACLAQIAVRPGHAYCVDLTKVPLRALQPLLDGEGVIVGHNLIFELQLLVAAGCSLPTTIGRRLWDTMLVDHLLGAHANRPPKGYYALENTARRQLGVELDKSEQTSDWSQRPLTESQLAYAAADAAVLLPLCRVQAAQVRQGELGKTARIEHRCLPAMALLAYQGVLVDLDRLGEPVGAAKAEADAASAQLHALLKGEAEKLPADDADAEVAARRARLEQGVNLNSWQQLLRMFADLGIEVPNTEEDTLARVDHPVAQVVVDYKHAYKQVSMYRKYPTYAARSATGRVHPEWRQIGSEAGRMACSSPNLQQVIKADVYRSCFRAAPGHVLIKADYSQIEVRIAAQFSQDQALLAAFGAGVDIHRHTAQRLTGRDTVTDAERGAAKVVVFGLLYGMGPRRLVDYARTKYRVMMTQEEADRYHAQFFRAYPELRRWQRSHPEGPLDTRTLTNRRRLAVKQFKQKCNTPVQGTGADGLKIALALMFERRADCPNARPIAVVHDEILVEVPQEHAAAAEEWVRAAMVDGMAPLLPDVRVEVDITTGPSWAKHDAEVSR